MKTKMNISNLKKLAITACIALMMIAGSYTQLRAEVPVTEVVSTEMARLENLAETIEVSLKYVAPAVDESDAVTPELERLEMLASVTETSLKYQAPEVIEISVGAVESILAENVSNQSE